MNFKTQKKYAIIALSEYHQRSELNPKCIPTISCLPAPLVRIEDHRSEVLSCEFHSSGRLGLSSSRDGEIHFWEITGVFSKMNRLKGHTEAVMEAHYSHDGLSIYSCSADETLGIWDAFIGVRTSTFKGHTNSVNSVQGARINNPVLCSGSKDGTVRIWDAREKDCAMTLECGLEVTATSFNENVDFAFSGGVGNDIKIWDLRMTEVICKLRGHTDSVTGLSLSPCGSYLLSHAQDNTLRIWDIRPFTADRSVLSLPTNQYSVTGLMRCAWSKDGTMISAGTSNCAVFAWDSKSGTKLFELQAHESSVNDVAFHPKQPIILSASNDNYTYMHELQK